MVCILELKPSEMDSRTLGSTPESGERAGCDGYRRRKGSKIHIAVDTLGHMLALRVSAAGAQDRAQWLVRPRQPQDRM
jgi:hypothetical protein